MADEEKKNAPFYEHRWFAGTVAVVGLIGAIWVLSVKVFDTTAQITANEKVYAYTQIILDTSEGMGEPFGDGTKLDAAVEAVEKYVVPLDAEGLALRRTGLSCDEGSRQLVDFGTGHADDVVDEAREQHAEGRSTLAYAVIEAIAEFRASDDFQGSASSRQIVIITGGVGGEECLGSEAGAEIRRQLEDSGIDATFKMVALSPTPSANERLQAFEQALGGEAEFAVVDTPEELEEAVDEDLEALSAEIDELADLEAESSEASEGAGGAEAGESGEGEAGEAGGDVSGEGGESPSTELESGSEGEAELTPPPAAEAEGAPPEGSPDLP